MEYPHFTLGNDEKEMLEELIDDLKDLSIQTQRTLCIACMAKAKKNNIAEVSNALAKLKQQMKLITQHQE